MKSKNPTSQSVSSLCTVDAQERMRETKSIHWVQYYSLIHASRSQCNLMMLRTTCSYLIATEGSYSLPTVQFPTGEGDDCS